jgi:hypothetical protein
MNRSLLSLALPIFFAAAGCGRPFKVSTAPGLVELDNQEPRYDYRAIAPEGVVMAVSVVDTGDRGDLEFWTRATILRVRQLNGYALLGTSVVTSRDGTRGMELRFGHDENGKAYLYGVRLHVSQGRLFVLETGGPRDEMDRYRASLEWMASSLKVRCPGFLSPVLSSNTCNRW